jgi:hypothetical protein
MTDQCCLTSAIARRSAQSPLLCLKLIGKTLDLTMNSCHPGFFLYISVFLLFEPKYYWHTIKLNVNVISIKQPRIMVKSKNKTQLPSALIKSMRPRKPSGFIANPLRFNLLHKGLNSEVIAPHIKLRFIALLTSKLGLRPA